MMSPLKSRGAAEATLDDLKRAETATRERVEIVETKLAELQTRYDHPEPEDTAESLAQIEKAIAVTKRELHLAAANHNRALEARVEAEKVRERDTLDRESAELARQTEAIVKATPTKIRKLATELMEATAEFTQLDRRIVAINKRRLAAGLPGLPLSEHLMRRTPALPDSEVEEEVEVKEWPARAQPGVGPSTKTVKKRVKRKVRGRAEIMPTPYAQILQIPGFAPGEQDFRVAGAPSPPYGGIWIDSSGCPRKW